MVFQIVCHGQFSILQICINGGVTGGTTQVRNSSCGGNSHGYMFSQKRRWW